MSKRRNNNNRNTDTSENEQTESVESQVDQEVVEELVDDITGDQDQPEIDESIDEVVEEIDAQIDNEHVEVDEQEEVEQMSQDTDKDQGFDQEPTPVAENSSGGKGMAGTAMAMSMLALAGTGYNWYDAKSSESTQSGSVEQAVDYSAQIQTLEQQIQSLTESQEKLASMSTTTESAVEETQAVVDSAAEEASEAEESVAAAEAEVVEEASTEATETMTQEIEAEQSAAAEEAEVAESGSEEVSETLVSETMVSETDELTASEASAAAQTEEVEAEMAAEASSEQVVEAESSTANEQTMGIAAAPNSDEIKQIARQEVDAVLAEAKKRLGLNEVAQLLSIGEQRLALAGDVTGAQAALGIANERLSAFSDPIVDPIRDSVVSNIESLSAVEVVDKSALTQDLGNLANAVDSLAFKPLETLAVEPAEEAVIEETAAASTEEVAEPSQSDGLSLEGAGSFIKSWGSKFGDTIGEVGSGIAGDLKDMVRIKKTGPMSDVVLAPEQEYFIRENMKLMLGGAQRAVLQNNVGVYQQNIGQAQSLLGEFFDGDNEDVQSVAGRLSDLAQINLEPELPDISNSSASLSEVLKQLASADSSAN